MGVLQIETATGGQKKIGEKTNKNHENGPLLQGESCTGKKKEKN